MGPKMRRQGIVASGISTFERGLSLLPNTWGTRTLCPPPTMQESDDTYYHQSLFLEALAANYNLLMPYHIYESVNRHHNVQAGIAL